MSWSEAVTGLYSHLTKERKNKHPRSLGPYVAFVGVTLCYNKRKKIAKLKAPPHPHSVSLNSHYSTEQQNNKLVNEIERIKKNK